MVIGCVSSRYYRGMGMIDRVLCEESEYFMFRDYDDVVIVGGLLR